MKKKIGSRQILLLILLLIAAVIPVFVRTPYLLSICVMTFYMASASLAWSILGGLTGQISWDMPPLWGWAHICPLFTG